MCTYGINQFKLGLKVIVGNDPYEIVKVEFVNPGKGQSFARVKLRNLVLNKILVRTFKSGEIIKSADISEIVLTYLYNDNFFWYFFDKNTFRQTQIDKDVISENIIWLVNKEEYIVTLWNNKAISVIPPNFIKLKVVKTDPDLKFIQLKHNVKKAVLSTGVIINVPLFIKVGEYIKVNTKTKEYVSRISMFE